ncbi:MAG TPA: hypothetical protein VF690_19070 [Hymenobacter sp.]
MPVRAHVLKFLTYYLGPNYFLSEADQFGAYLYSQMRRPREDARRDHVLESYESKWRVHFGCLSPKKHGLRLSGKTVQQFDHFINCILEAELIGYVALNVRFGNKIKYAIEEYMAERNISEEDIAFETLYKRYQRDCSEKKAKKKPLVAAGRPAAEVRQQLLRMPLPTPAASATSAAAY